jgi:hypothetical protein
MVTVATGCMAEGLGDMALADADRPVQDDRLACLDKSQRGEVADPPARPGNGNSVTELSGNYVTAGQGIT